MLVFNLPAFQNQNWYTADDRFHGKGPYGEILTKKEPIRTLGFSLPYNKTIVDVIQNMPLSISINLHFYKHAKTNDKRVRRFGDILAPLSKETKLNMRF